MNNAKTYLDLVVATDESIAEHDDRFHGGHYDEKTMYCEKRRNQGKVDGADVILNADETHSEPGHIRFGRRMKKLYDEYVKSGITDNLIENVLSAVDDLKSGKEVPERLPGDTFRGGVVGIPDWFIGMYCLSVKDHDSYGIGMFGSKLLEDFAKAASAYVEDVESYFKARSEYREFAQGAEAEVFRETEDEVIKVTDLSYTQSMIQRYERLILGNLIFPETATEIVAVGKSKTKSLSDLFILRQKLFQYATVSDNDICEWFDDKGFSPDRNMLERFISRDGQIACGDCHVGNVVENLDDEDGDFINIDPCIEIIYDVANPPTNLLLKRGSK